MNSKVYGVIFLAMAVTVTVVLFMAMQSGRESKAELREQKADEIFKMDCLELKKYLEEGNVSNVSNEVGRFSTAGLHFDNLNCKKEVGYLNYEHDSCVQWDRGLGCLQNNFPLVGDTVIFPHDWYYVDAKTGKQIDDPNEFLKQFPYKKSFWDSNVYTKGVKDENAIQMYCFDGWGKARIFSKADCNYGFDKNGLIFDRSSEGNLLYQNRFADGSLRFRLKEIPDIEAFTCSDNWQNQLECRYFNSYYVFRVDGR